MRLDVGIVSPNPDLFEDAIWHAARFAGAPINVLGFGNGCDLAMPKKHRSVRNVVLERSAVNGSIPAAMHRLWQMSVALDARHPANDVVLVYIHDDTLILEPGWDETVRRIFLADPACGLGGFFGAKSAGTADLYRKPYRIDQLARGRTYSNMTDAENHGVRTTTPTRIVLTDGFSVLCRRRFLDKIAGWSWWPKNCPHHGYDLAIACMAKRHGFTAWLVPVLCSHWEQFADLEISLTEKYGGPRRVFEASHRFVYEQFRDVLPMHVP